ncbi:MAG: radical SAM protein [Dehalococcoidales bacterium]
MNRKDFKPSYIDLCISGELAKRAARLESRLEKCDICPRNCGVNRLRGEMGYCNSAAKPIVASYCAHFGEEPAISGSRGSGTIFFGNCNMACAYCQNYQISQNPFCQKNNQVSIEELAGFMLQLQQMDCHNINLVSPTHFIAQIVPAINLASQRGLKLPIVYNTNGYDSPGTLVELDGVISVYLPDIKYSSNQMSQRFSDAPNYVENSRAAILEMYRQTGGLVLDEGVAIKGVLIRHLVLPDDIGGSEDSLKWLAYNIGKGVALSLMSQYYPAHHAGRYREISRPITRDEYFRAFKVAKQLGFKQIFAQQMESPGVYLPDFNCEKPFGG